MRYARDICGRWRCARTRGTPLIYSDGNEAQLGDVVAISVRHRASSLLVSIATSIRPSTPGNNGPTWGKASWWTPISEGSFTMRTAGMSISPSWPVHIGELECKFLPPSFRCLRRPCSHLC